MLYEKNLRRHKLDLDYCKGCFREFSTDCMNCFECRKGSNFILKGSIMEIQAGRKYKRYYEKSGNPFEEHPKFKDEVTIIDKRAGSWVGASGKVYEEDFVQFTIKDLVCIYSSPLSVFIGTYTIEEVL